jgi:hypothetical protein
LCNRGKDTKEEREGSINLSSGCPTAANLSIVDLDRGDAGIAGEWARTHLSDAISGVVGSLATTTAARTAVVVAVVVTIVVTIVVTVVVAL